MSYLDERRLARGDGWTLKDWREECCKAGQDIDRLRAEVAAAKAEAEKAKAGTERLTNALDAEKAVSAGLSHGLAESESARKRLEFIALAVQGLPYEERLALYAVADEEENKQIAIDAAPKQEGGA